jgi:hypothetical protein
MPDGQMDNTKQSESEPAQGKQPIKPKQHQRKYLQCSTGRQHYTLDLPRLMMDRLWAIGARQGINSRNWLVTQAVQSYIQACYDHSKTRLDKRRSSQLGDAGLQPAKDEPPPHDESRAGSD